MRTAGEKFAHYEIRSLLGQGGMGEVYLAFDTKLHRRVALKLLLTSESLGEEAKADAVARIIREARAAAALEHPNKVSIFELGEVDGTPYLAMEYIAGSTLRAFVGDSAIDWKQKLGWLLDVARALGAAHEEGLVHRDIKPENVMVRKDGVVKVLDFGIARRADSAVGDAGVTTPAIEALTGKGVVIGTAAYMPPEQVQGQDLDGRADQFAWGVMAYELLSGGHPWATDAGALAMVAAMLTKPAPPLEGFPEVVARSVARALSAKREDRFASMREIVEALAGVAAPSGPIAVVDGGNAAMASDVASAPTDVASGPTDVAMARTEAVEKTPAPSPAPAVASTKKPRGRALRLVLAAVGVLAVALAVGAWRWNATRQTVEYCFDVVTTSKGPRCLGQVSPETMSRRDITYRLTSGPFGVDTIERLNTAGLVLPHDVHRLHRANDPAARTEVRRGPDGAVREIVARDKYGRELRHEAWSEDGARVDYVESDGKTPRHLDGSRVVTHRREYDARGFVSREVYVGMTGKPRSSEQGVFGRLLEHRADGFLLRETHLGWDGKPMADRRGIARAEHTPDARGAEVESRTLDLDGNPTPVEGVVVQRLEYTTDLDLVGLTYFDGAGTKVADLGYGAHGLRKTFHPDGRGFATTFLDEGGRPRQHRGDAYATVDVTLDERGRAIEVAYLDIAGNPIVTREQGIAFWRTVWSERDDPDEVHALDPSRQPMPCAYGFGIRRRVRDDKGRVIEERHFDAEGKPAPTIEDPAIMKITYDDRDQITQISLFDAESRPAPHLEGFFSTSSKFDRHRNQLEWTVFGLDGKPTLEKSGVSVERFRYDDDDNSVEHSKLDTAGALTFAGDYARRLRKYDDRGFVIEESYFDTNDNPFTGKNGYAIVRYGRDRSGDITEESYFGKRGEPIARVGGYAKKKNAHDVRRQRVETALLDAAAEPVLGSDGWATERIVYDQRGLVVRESHLDVTGNAVVTKSGSAAVTKKYDARGNLVEVATFGADDKPRATDDGYALKRSSYDERDQLIEESLFGADGAPTVGASGWSVRKLRYDDLGIVADESFLDADRKPVVAKDPAYARKRDKYDARRRLVETSYFDPGGAPAKGPEGVETIRYARDAFGRAVETSYFDGASAPAVSKDGKQVVRSKYDGAGRLIEALFVDAAGLPKTATDGCAGRRNRYDELGRTIEETCVHDKGAPAVSAEGWASKRMLRDGRGRVVEEATYGADAKLRADASGIARKKNRYDERGLLEETTFWSADDKPAKDARGAVAVRFKYDDAGKQAEELAVDDKGKVLPPAVTTGAAAATAPTKP